MAFRGLSQPASETLWCGTWTQPGSPNSSPNRNLSPNLMRRQKMSHFLTGPVLLHNVAAAASAVLEQQRLLAALHPQLHSPRSLYLWSQVLPCPICFVLVLQRHRRVGEYRVCVRLQPQLHGDRGRWSLCAADPKGGPRPRQQCHPSQAPQQSSAPPCRADTCGPAWTHHTWAGTYSSAPAPAPTCLPARCVRRG